MPQAFGFSFNNEDIEDEDREMSATINEEERPADIREMAKPKLHILQEMLSTLPDTISYSTVEVKVLESQVRHNRVSLPRRELFDIRAQLMAEDTGLDKSVTASLSADDITPNIYEGGFKTWECSLDLASYLGYYGPRSRTFGPKNMHIVELGAGSGLPILSLFQDLMVDELPEPLPGIQLTVTDYNPSVLHLSTIPNLLLGWATSLDIQSPCSGDLEVTQDLQQRFTDSLNHLGINISAISGGWSSDLVDLVLRHHPPPKGRIIPCDTLILASETIYSPSTIRLFTSTLLELLKATEERGCGSTALIAAKKVYFGVGGGVDEFLTVLDEMGGQASVVWENGGEGVGRVILEVVVRR